MNNIQVKNEIFENNFATMEELIDDPDIKSLNLNIDFKSAMKFR